MYIYPIIKGLILSATANWDGNPIRYCRNAKISSAYFVNIVDWNRKATEGYLPWTLYILSCAAQARVLVIIHVRTIFTKLNVRFLLYHRNAQYNKSKC